MGYRAPARSPLGVPRSHGAGWRGWNSWVVPAPGHPRGRGSWGAGGTSDGVVARVRLGWLRKPMEPSLALALPVVFLACMVCSEGCMDADRGICARATFFEDFRARISLEKLTQVPAGRY